MQFLFFVGGLFHLGYGRRAAVGVGPLGHSETTPELALLQPDPLPERAEPRWRLRNWERPPHASRRPSPPAEKRRSRGGLGILLAIFSIPFIVEMATVVSIAQRPFFTYGDYALADVAVHRATQFHQLLGPYSRFGWSHPGPMSFYLLAPFYGLFGSALGLWFGTILLNFSALAIAIALVHRREGLPAATWTALVLAVFVHSVGPWYMENPWGPNLSSIALVLCIVAAACRPSRWTVPILILASSYAVQTHVGLAGVVTALVGVATVTHLIAIKTHHGSWLLSPTTSIRTSFGPVFAVLAAFICWLPVLVETAIATPPNVQTLGTFLLNQERHRGYLDTFQIMIAGGWLPTSPAIGQISAPRPTVLIESLVLMGLSVCASALAYRQRQRFALIMCAYPLIAYVVGTAGLAVAEGDILDYMLWWVPVMQVSMLIGIGLVVLHARPVGWILGHVPKLIVTASAMTVLSVLTVMITTATLHNSELGKQNRADVKQVWSAISPHVSHDDLVFVDIRDGGLAPLAAGVVDELDRNGIPWRVAPEWRYQLTELPSVASRDDSVIITLTPTNGDESAPYDAIHVNGTVPATVTAYYP